MTTPASANAYVTILGNFPLTAPATSLGLGIFFALWGSYEYLAFLLQYQDGANNHNGSIKLTKADKKVWLRTNTGAWTEVGAWNPSTYAGYDWYYCKLVYDLASHKYKRVILQGAEIDVSSYSCYVSADTHSRLGISMNLWGAAAGACTCLVDCITLTTQEP